MFVRVTPFRVKSEAMEAALGRFSGIEGTLHKMKAIRHLSIVVDDDGAGYAIAYLSDEAMLERHEETIADLWAGFLDDFEVIPTPECYRVVASWSLPET